VEGSAIAWRVGVGLGGGVGASGYEMGWGCSVVVVVQREFEVSRSRISEQAPLTQPVRPKSTTPTPLTKQERDFVSKYAESEIINHSMLRHPHVVCFREVFLSKGHINMCV